MDDRWCLQESIQRLPIKLDQLPSDSNQALAGRIVFWVVQIRIKHLDQGHVNVTIFILGQGPVPVPLDQLPSKLVILSHKKIHIPFWKDFPGVNILSITFPCDLRNESCRIVWFPRLGGWCFPLSRSHLHQKNHKKQVRQVFIWTESRKIKLKNRLGA